jgi:hypothetical protein
MAENTKSIPEGYTVQREGEAKILQKHNETFYNPAQVRTTRPTLCMGTR